MSSGSEQRIKVVLADDHTVVRQGLRALLMAEPDIEIVGEAENGRQAIHMTNRGGKICLAAFPHDDAKLDIAHLVRNNIYAYGIRGECRSATHRAMALMAEKRFDATRIHTHTFPLAELPEALRYARDRVEDAIKVVVKTR